MNRSVQYCIAPGINIFTLAFNLTCQKNHWWSSVFYETEKKYYSTAKTSNLFMLRLVKSFEKTISLYITPLFFVPTDNKA